MRKKTLRILICILVLALTVHLGSCAFRPGPARTEDGEVLLRLGFSGTPDSLNPYAAGTREAAAVLSLLYDTLFTVDLRTGEIVGNLCRECSVSDAAAGGKLWRITLSPDARWHDGTRVTASDVEFSLQSAKDFSTLYGYPECELIDTTGIAVEDEDHLSMIVWGETSYVGEFLSRVPILPRAVWNRPGSMDYGKAGIPADAVRAREELYAIPADADTMIGSGLYIWGGYENGVCTLRLNRDYWNGSARAEVVELRFGLLDPAASLRRGEVDACWDLPQTDHRELVSSREWRFSQGTRGEQYLVSFNLHPEAVSTGSDLLREPSVRRAIDLCLDRDSILTGIFGGGIPDPGLLSPESVYAYDVSSFESFRSHDPAAAARELEGAGFRDTDGDGVRESVTGRPLSFTLLCSGAHPAWREAADRISESCAGAGIRLFVETLSPSELYSRVEKWDYDLCLMSMPVYLDPYFSLGSFYWKNGDNAYSVPDDRGRFTSRGWNESGFRDDYFDALYERMLSEGNVEARKALTEQMGRYLYDYAVSLNLGFSAAYQACTTVWAGVYPFKGTGLYFTPLTLRQQIQGMTAGGR